MGPRGKYRSRLQIIADILHIVEDGSKKTRIMFQANLSHRLLRRYLDTTLEAGLVCLNDSSEYVITPKGRLFLEKFREYSERVNHVTNDKVVLEDMCLVPKRNETKRLDVLPVDSALRNVSE